MKRNSKLLFSINFFILIFVFAIAKAENDLINPKNNQIKIEYLESRNELEDYIIDTGDVISLVFEPANNLNGIFPVNREGEMLLPTLDETYVRGLTPSELEILLEKKYSKYLINPDIKLNIAAFKSIRVLIRGEVRNPGFYKFPSYKSASFLRGESNLSPQFPSSLTIDEKSEWALGDLKINSRSNNISNNNLILKKSSENVTTISDLIRKAGGITSETDLSRIQIIRDVPLGKGGGKKTATIDFNSYMNGSDSIDDIRLFDGDSLFIPRLKKPNPNQISKSILSGISPKFISVNIYGRVENPGVVELPLEATLSDVIDLTGPIKPLSGKIVLIRYNRDGTVFKSNISYSSRSDRGSSRNPYIKDGDLITVKNSFLGRSTGIIKDITEPFVGLYSTKEIIESFND